MQGTNLARLVSARKTETSEGYAEKREGGGLRDSDGNLFGGQVRATYRARERPAHADPLR